MLEADGDVAGVLGELEMVDVKGKPPCGSCLQRYPAALAVPGLSEASMGSLYSVPLMRTERLTPSTVR